MGKTSTKTPRKEAPLQESYNYTTQSCAEVAAALTQRCTLEGLRVRRNIGIEKSTLHNPQNVCFLARSPQSHMVSILVFLGVVSENEHQSFQIQKSIMCPLPTSAFMQNRLTGHLPRLSESTAIPAPRGGVRQRGASRSPGHPDRQPDPGGPEPRRLVQVGLRVGQRHQGQRGGPGEERRQRERGHAGPGRLQLQGRRRGRDCFDLHRR